jgi:hypothetical protein
VVEVEGVELAWSEMQVLILNDDGEEAEALIVVPALEDVSGERLWRGFGGFSRFDLGRALHFRVRVKRVEVGAPSSRYSRFRLVPSLPTIGEELWRRPVIKPRPRPPEVRPKPPARKEIPNFRRPQVKPVVPKPVIGRWGSKFKSSFKFCPYRYYGKLSLFRKALCQRSWERWYTKQWKKGSVYNRPLQIYNTALREGDGAVVYLRDKTNGTQLLVAGMEGLDVRGARGLLDFAATISQPQMDPAYEQALELLNQLEWEDGWVIALVEAYGEGRFDEEYEQLLPQGLREYQDAYQQLLEVTLDREISDEELKESLKSYIGWLASNRDIFELLYSQDDHENGDGDGSFFETKGRLPREAIQEAHHFFAENLWGHPVSSCIAQATAPPEEQALRNLAEWYNKALFLTDDAFGGWVADHLAGAVGIIARDVAGQGEDLCRFLWNSRLREVLWMIIVAIRAGNHEEAAELISELLVAAFAIHHGGWHFAGLHLPVGGGILRPPLAEIDLVLYHPDLGGESVLAFVNVLNTNNPLGRKDEILSWINGSLKYLREQVFCPDKRQYIFNNGPFRVETDMAMLVLVFHGRAQDNQTMLDLARRLGADIDNPTSIPVIMVWENEEGNVWYTCISGCDNVTEEQMARTACAMLGHPPNCGAQKAEDSSAHVTTPPPQEPKEPPQEDPEPIVVSPPPPPPCLSCPPQLY